MADTTTNNNEDTAVAVPEELFHTILTVIDYHTDTSGSTRTVYVLGTHTSLAAAKAFTLHALQDLKYEPEDFAVFATRATTPAEEWKYGDGVLVYAEAPAGQIFLLGIDTKPNTESLPSGGPDNTPLLPRDYTHLHYVMQNKTDYNQDKSGAYQSSEIEGCYVYRADAVNAALALLAPDKGEFAQYDERTSVHDDPESDWPYGEDVFVHAVAETGENYTVAVRTVPGAHKRYAKKH